MPLPRQLFDLGISPDCERLMRQAYMLLAESRELAYSLEEIESELTKDSTYPFMPEELARALDTLATLGAVDKRNLLETDYFAFLGEFDTGTWFSRRHFTGG